MILQKIIERILTTVTVAGVCFLTTIRESLYKTDNHNLIDFNQLLNKCASVDFNITV